MHGMLVSPAGASKHLLLGVTDRNNHQHIALVGSNQSRKQQGKELQNAAVFSSYQSSVVLRK